VQHKGSKAVDASLLLMPLMRFISPVEKRWRTTLAAIERDLGADVLIYRYKNVLEKIDGLEGTEGTFTMCSFWYVECLAKTGHIEQAREYFEKMLGYTNHVGLFSEQLSVKGEHLGNYPQAFTHLALISAALELNKDLEKEVRPEGY
jgi:GH15 family glucan-1,4-alpha-glucosidase